MAAFREDVLADWIAGNNSRWQSWRFGLQRRRCSHSGFDYRQSPTQWLRWWECELRWPGKARMLERGGSVRLQRQYQHVQLLLLRCRSSRRLSRTDSPAWLSQTG